MEESLLGLVAVEELDADEFEAEEFAAEELEADGDLDSLFFHGV